MTADGGPPDNKTLDRLAAALAHRGPDGSGRHVAHDTGLVHTRLAIIDLEHGAQPLLADDTALVANGEIYNYLELRPQIDVPFHTASDCEPPLHLYRRDGTGFTAALRGMYAIAVHDAAARRLVLARDPFGIKPLYYAETPAGFAFASEAQAIIAAGLVAPSVRPAARDQLLQRQFTSGPETIFAGIRRVLPGETITVEQGRITGRSRRAVLSDAGPADWTEAEALGRLDRVLAESVELHQRADVPYGMFLSGGIDSGTVLALMARLNDRPVKAFTAWFDESGVADERVAAGAMASGVGAEHVEVAFTRADFVALLPQVAAAMDDPVADYAILPTFKLAAEARRHVKVILSGEGGDEMFAGYGRYRALMRPWWLGGRRGRSRGAFDRVDVLAARMKPRHEPAPLSTGWTRLQAAQAADCADWLPHDLLLKLDRCLMAHGVEGRTPLLDSAVAELAFCLPDRLKVRGRVGKYLLRRWLAANLPAARPFSPKQGFTVPVGRWIAHHGEALGELVAAQPTIREIARPEAVRALMRRADSRHAARPAWTLLFYALWYRRHVDGRIAAGDLFETLEDGRG